MTIATIHSTDTLSTASVVVAAGRRRGRPPLDRTALKSAEVAHAETGGEADALGLTAADYAEVDAEGAASVAAVPAASETPVAAAAADLAASTAPALIVLGRDDAGKTHASWFTSDEAELASKAAGLMGMATLEVATEALVKAAARLPHGRVFASGKAFVPFVKAAVFEALAANLPAIVRIKLNGRRQPVAPPTTRNAGSVVAVLDRSSAGKASATGGRGAKAAANAAPGDADGSAGASEPVAPSLPKDWSEIAVGSLVLASEGTDDGWYEALVIEAHEDALFTLRWQSWPDLPSFVRRSRHLGLLHPDHASE